MTTPIVPDHAVVRFLQRAFGRTEESIGALWRAGVDVDDIRQAIAEAVAQGVENGAPGVTWRNVRFMLVGAVVTTVLTREQFYSTHRSTSLNAFGRRRMVGARS